MQPSSRVAENIAFGRFRLDVTRRSLVRGSETTKLPGRLFGVLSLLVRANGAIVDKQTFASVVWPDVIMTHSNLAQHVYQLRRLLGDEKRNGSSIVAASGRGYRMTLPVSIEGALGAYESTPADWAALSSRELDPLVYFAHGCHLLERHSAWAFKRAIEFFDAALDVDQEYAPALVGLARAYVLLAEYGFVPSASAFRNASDAIARALGVSPDSSVAHAVYSQLLAFGEWDWARATREIDVALQLDPRSSLVRGTAAWLHLCAGSYRRAMIEAQLALRAEPESLTPLLLLAEVLIHSGRYRQAIAILSHLLEIDSTVHIARRYRAQAYLFDDRPADAITDLGLLPSARLEDLSGRLPLLARAYADCGDTAHAWRIYSGLLDAARTEYVTFWNLAIVATGLGEAGDAIGYLEESLAAREPALRLGKNLPWFKPLSRLPRFQELLQKSAS
jgi:DNA-binding winged helix-turn-helix (wHTH) protein